VTDCSFLIVYRIRQLSIIAGTNKLTSGGEARAVLESIPHKKYRNRLNDIALMRLESPLLFSAAIRPIEIAAEEVPAGLPVFVAGWGKTSSFGTVTNRLKVNTLRAMSKRSCLNSLGTRYSGIMCLGHSRNNGACYVRLDSLKFLITVSYFSG
jgi:trypsin